MIHQAESWKKGQRFDKKIPNTSGLIKNNDYDGKIIEIEKKKKKQVLVIYFLIMR